MTDSELWQCVASARGGGTVAALAGSADLQLAATSAGVFRSWDHGLTWHASGPGALPPLAEAVALSPEFLRDRTLYTCAADGLYRSTNAGDSWHPVLVGSQMLSVACPTGAIVLAGTEADGVLRSTDAGRAWQSASAGLLDLGVTCLAARGELAFAGTQGGLHRSRNSGQAWRAIGPQGPIQCLALSADGGLIFAGTEHAGLFRSTDDGATWQPLRFDDSHPVLALAVDGHHVVAATPQSIAVSRDAGLSWRTTSAPGVVLALAISRAGLLAGLHQDGLIRSVDDGLTWSGPDTDVNARLISAAAFARDGTLYVADIDAGLRASSDSGKSWRACPGPGEPASAVAISADDVLFAGGSAGVYVARPGAESWSLLLPSGMFDAAAVTAIAPAEHGTLFIATRAATEVSVWCSTGDALQRCLRIPSDAALRLAASADGSVVAAAGNRVFDLTECPSAEYACVGGSATALAVRDRTIFLGMTDGVYLSQHGGQSCVRWSEGLPDSTRMVALGPLDEAVYAVTFGGDVWRRRYPPAGLQLG